MQDSTKKTKTQKVLDYLLDGNTITGNECLLMFRCSSLAQRIQAIEEKGYKIKSTRIITDNGENIARYVMKIDLSNFKNEPNELKYFVYKVTQNRTAKKDLENELVKYFDSIKYVRREASLFD